MKISKSDNGFVLENADGETLSLSAQELAELVRDSHRLLDPNAKFQPQATMKVDDVRLGLDAHHTLAILRLIGLDGAETAFEIPGDSVRALAEALVRKAEQIEKTQSDKTAH